MRHTRVDSGATRIDSRGTRVDSSALVPPESSLVPPESTMVPLESTLVPPTSTLLSPKAPLVPPESILVPPESTLDDALRHTFRARMRICWTKLINEEDDCKDQDNCLLDYFSLFDVYWISFCLLTFSPFNAFFY